MAQGSAVAPEAIKAAYDRLGDFKAVAAELGCVPITVMSHLRALGVIAPQRRYSGHQILSFFKRGNGLVLSIPELFAELHKEDPTQTRKGIEGAIFRLRNGKVVPLYIADWIPTQYKPLPCYALAPGVDVPYEYSVARIQDTAKRRAVFAELAITTAALPPRSAFTGPCPVEMPPAVQRAMSRTSPASPMDLLGYGDF